MKKDEKKETDFEKIFTKIETEAGPVGDWFGYMRKAAILPDSIAKQIPPGTYKALIGFVVSHEGNLRDIKVDQDPGHGLGKRALDIFSSYRGRWRPGNQCGRAVMSYKKEAVVFVVPEH